MLDRRLLHADAQVLAEHVRVVQVAEDVLERLQRFTISAASGTNARTGSTR